MQALILLRPVKPTLRQSLILRVKKKTYRAIPLPLILQAALSSLQAWWAKDGSAFALRFIRKPDAETQARAWHLVSALGGGAGLIPAGDDEAIMRELVGMGEGAVPALVLGLKFPPGFAPKRVLICQALGRIGSVEAAPALAATLRDVVTRQRPASRLPKIDRDFIERFLMRYKTRGAL